MRDSTLAVVTPAALETLEETAELLARAITVIEAARAATEASEELQAQSNPQSSTVSTTLDEVVDSPSVVGVFTAGKWEGESVYFREGRSPYRLSSGRFFPLDAVLEWSDRGHIEWTHPSEPRRLLSLPRRVPPPLTAARADVVYEGLKAA